MPAVPGDVIRARAARLRDAGAAALARHLDGEVGTRRRVLTERGDTGRTEAFSLVRFAESVSAGEIREVTVKGHDGQALLAA